MKIVELVIENEKDGIDAISVVDRPAIESDFIALSSQIEVELKEVSTEKKILMGAALIPNKKIYRKEDVLQMKQMQIFLFLFIVTHIVLRRRELKLLF